MKKAFTLIELIIAIVLITIIVLAIIFVFNPKKSKSQLTINITNSLNWGIL